jgi:hypothetical protein
VIGTGSATVNSQLIPVPTTQAYDPLAFGQAYAPSAMWPRQGVYMVPPMLPAGSLASSMAPSAYGGSVPTATNSNGNPLSFTKSPVLFALGAFIIGVLMLMHIHYK